MTAPTTALAASRAAQEWLANHPSARLHDEDTPNGGGHSWKCIPIGEAIEYFGTHPVIVPAEREGEASGVAAVVSQMGTFRRTLPDDNPAPGWASLIAEWEADLRRFLAAATPEEKP